MQALNAPAAASSIPEYYLYWTFQRPYLLKNRLRTIEKLPLAIIDPGQRNLDNGPDFTDALLKINHVLTRGDIEFHLHWQDWFRHGHQHDRRYQRVILHVLWYPPKQLPESLRQRFSHLVLSRHLKLKPKPWLEFMKRLQQEGEKSAPEAVSSLPGSALLDELAWNRFFRKCDELDDDLRQFGWNDTLYVGLARALGYSKNSAPFMQLVRSFPPSLLFRNVHPLQRSPLLFWILLAWHGGLLERPFLNIKKNTPQNLLKIIHHVRKRYAGVLPASGQNLLQWQFSRLRPGNNPYFRLAGLAQLLFEYQNQDLFQNLLNLFSGRLSLEGLLQGVEKILCLPLSLQFPPYLKELLGYQRLPANAIGRDRCRQFILNILLPLFYVWGRLHNSPGFQMYLEDLYYSFPAADDTPILRHFSGPGQERAAKKAYIQQALLEYCQQNYSPDIPKNRLTTRP